MTTLTTLDTIIAGLVTVVRNNLKVPLVPDFPPEQVAQFPLALVTPATGDIKWTAHGFITCMHAVVLEIHLQRIDLPFDVERALDYGPETVAKAIFNDPSLGSIFNAGAVEGPISYYFGLLGYFGQRTIGWQYRIQNIKSQGATS